MAVAVCTPCDRYFVVEEQLFVEPLCPRCFQPLQPAPKAAIRVHLHREQKREPANDLAAPVPTDTQPDSQPFDRLSAEESLAAAAVLLERIQTLRAITAHRRGEIVLRLGDSRRLRHQLSEQLEELHRIVTPPAPPARL